MEISGKRNKNSSDSGEAGMLGACETISWTRKCSSYFHRDIIFNILKSVPAEVVHKTMRYVCKEWNDVISDPFFISAHLSHSSSSSPGIVVLKDDDSRLIRGAPKRAFHIRTDNATGEKNLSEHEIPYHLSILGSCNGLVLLRDQRNQQVLQLMNLATKVKMALPPVTGRVCIFPSPITAFAVTPSGQYKVLYVSTPLKKPVLPYFIQRRGVKVMVCTVGVDKAWRAVDYKKDMAAMSRKHYKLLMNRPFSGAGYVYWLDDRYKFGFALDVESETMHQFANPGDFVGLQAILQEPVKSETGGGCIMHIVDTEENHIQKFWKMMEPKSGNWVKDIDLNSDDMLSRLKSLFDPSTLRRYMVLVRLENGDVWISIEVDESFALVCYNQKTQYAWSPPQRWLTRLWPQDVHIHVDSLISI